MNSYTIKIADYELKLRCGLTPEQLNATAKKVDDCIKLICSKSTNITKTEAAILCALEFCSMADSAEQNAGANDDQLEQLAEENKKAFAALAKMEAKLEAQKAKADANAAMVKERYEANMNAQKEKYEGRIENMKTKYEARIEQLKAKLEEAKAAAETDTKQISMFADEAPAAPAEEVVEEAVVAEPEVEAVVEEVTAADEADKKKTAKSKVGSMFELLTFGDV